LARRGSPLDTRGPELAAFARDYCRHTKGRQWAGEPVIFEPWQRDFWNEALRIGPDGKRVYREVLLGLPRKNGKSLQASTFAGYMLGFDDEGPEVYSAAAAKNQAGIVFGQFRTMVRKSPDLDASQGGIFRIRQYHIECPENDGIYRVISADAPLQHGLNPSANIIDEFWAHPSWDLYDALTSAGAAREQPLTLTITTAGWSLETPLGELYQRGMAMPELERRGHLTIGRNRETGFLFWWYGATDEDDLEDPRVWMAVNPASWVTEEFLRRERTKESMRDEVFQQLHLNYWTRAVASFLKPGQWRACADPVIACSCRPPCTPGTCLTGFDPTLPLAVALDISYRQDSTAVVMAQRQGDRVIERARVWENPYPPRHALHDEWSVPREEVKDHLRMLRREFPVHAVELDGVARPGPRFGYDPTMGIFDDDARELMAEGLAMEVFPQSDRRMIQASEAFDGLIVEKNLVHDGDAKFAEHVANAIADRKGHNHWRLSKPKGSRVKIDAAVAGAMAAWLALQPAPEPPRKRSNRLVFLR
jgi:phage terminase large subunit-like protein